MEIPFDLLPESEEPLPLVLRLLPDVLAEPRLNVPHGQNGDLDRFLLAQRPNLEESAFAEPQHPSRWYARIEGDGFDSWIRGHLQLKEDGPRVVLDNHPDSVLFPREAPMVGNGSGPHRFTAVHPDPEYLRSRYVYLNGRVIMTLVFSGWVGEGIDMAFKPSPKGPDFSLSVYPLQTGREFVPPFGQGHFFMDSKDLRYNRFRG